MTQTKPNDPARIFAQQLRSACEAKFRSVPSLHLAICRVFGDEAISLATLKRMLDSKGYRPRGRRPYIQLKRVLPELVIPSES